MDKWDGDILLFVFFTWLKKKVDTVLVFQKGKIYLLF